MKKPPLAILKQNIFLFIKQKMYTRNFFLLISAPIRTHQEIQCLLYEYKGFFWLLKQYYICALFLLMQGPLSSEKADI